jgi:sulfide dehydrogenase cytochrome subunit
MLLLALIAGPAAAADAMPAGARLAATCTGCHGTNGVTVGNALPGLAGQPKDALLTSLKAFRSGDRPATVMTQLTKGYTEEQLDRIAEFFSLQQAAPAPQPAGTVP